MIHLVLDRFATCPEMGTFGRLSIAALAVAVPPAPIAPITPAIYTAERPWLDNQRRVSCIPAGEYTCAPRPFYRGAYRAWEVLDVPNRSDILWHRGNRSSDVEGCIVVGLTLGALGGEWAVLDSSGAWDRLREVVGGEAARFRLSIRWTIP